MSAVVAFTHRGVASALPAAQVIEVAPAPNDASTLALWEGVDLHGALSLHVHAPMGDTWIGCVEPAMTDLPIATAWPLSPVLRDCLRDAPHIVGAVSTRGGLRWLVDLNRMPASRGSSHE